jgi:hypothetical protein
MFLHRMLVERGAKQELTAGQQSRVLLLLLLSACS